MTSTFFILIILIAVVITVVIHNHVDRLPLPIGFILMGVVISLFPLYHNFTFNPELFLFFVVTPLLYNETQSASRYWIGRGAINIASLSIALVITTVVIVGAALHLLFPIVPLALAFALCAIVTPTDASAVSAFSKPNQKFQVPFIILQNESLFNDASGFVAFDLAMLAFATGTFSVNGAVGIFFLEFIGGLIVGAIIGFLFHAVRTRLISSADDSPFVMVSLELIVPFLVYYLADHFDLSGILAVVAAGLVQGAENDNLQLISSRMQLVRANVWEIVEEALTGIVFILLGVSLPTIINHITTKRPGLLLTLIIIGFILYLLKFALRLLWTRFLVWTHVTSDHRWLDSLLMTVSGASGTISLSLAFLLPTITNNAAIDRNALIFVVAIVILISLTIAAVAVPRITKVADQDPAEKPLSQWTREMIMTAMANVRGNKEHPAEAQIVVDALSQQLHQTNRPRHREQRRLYEFAYSAEQTAIKHMHDHGDITDDEYYYYRQFLDLSLLTVGNNPLQNLLLRIRFGIHTGRLYQDLQSGQEMFFTTPLIAEQYYWQRQFAAHDEDIHPLEEVGFQAAIKAFKTYRHENGSGITVELHTVQRFYRERHRRMNMSAPDEQVVYQIFLTAFHAEYEFFERAVASGEMSVETAEALQQHIIFDEMAYIQNTANFVD